MSRLLFWRFRGAAHSQTTDAVAAAMVWAVAAASASVGSASVPASAAASTWAVSGAITTQFTFANPRFATWVAPAASAAVGGVSTAATESAATWTVEPASGTLGIGTTTTAVWATWAVAAAGTTAGAVTATTTALAVTWGVPVATSAAGGITASAATAAAATWVVADAASAQVAYTTAVHATWAIDEIAVVTVGSVTIPATAAYATWSVPRANFSTVPGAVVIFRWVVPSPAIAELVTDDLVVPTTVGRRAIRRLRQTPHLSDERIMLFFSQLKVDMETGVGTLNGQGEAPKMMLQWSTDRGHTWSNEHWVDCGPLGAYRWRAIWRRLGRSRDMVFRVVVTDPIPVTLIDAYVDVSKGTS